MELSARPHHGICEVVVSDNGPGIPTHQRQRVLERFVRLETARSTHGNGLGLSLVQAVADLHGAELSLADNHPGLQVTLRLDVAREAPDRPAASR